MPRSESTACFASVNARRPLRVLRPRRAPCAAARDAATGAVLGGTAPVGGRLELDRPHRLADRLRALLQRCSLVRGELDLDHLLEAVLAKLAWYAQVQPLHPVLSLEPGGARQDPTLILDDRFGHLDRARRRSVVRRAGLEVLDD